MIKKRKENHKILLGLIFPQESEVTSVFPVTQTQDYWGDQTRYLL